MGTASLASPRARQPSLAEEFMRATAGRPPSAPKFRMIQGTKAGRARQVLDGEFRRATAGSDLPDHLRVRCALVARHQRDEVLVAHRDSLLERAGKRRASRQIPQ